MHKTTSTKLFRGIKWPLAALLALSASLCIALPTLVSAEELASAEELSPLAAGQEAFNAGDYTLAFSLWSTLATQGNAEAQVFVGLAYDNGWGTPRSPQLARVWYQKAAANNNSSGQFLLGLHFIQGATEDRAKGLMWLQRAASNGDRAAQQFIQKGQNKGWFKGIPTIVEQETSPETTHESSHEITVGTHQSPSPAEDTPKEAQSTTTSQTLALAP